MLPTRTLYYSSHSCLHTDCSNCIHLVLSAIYRRNYLYSNPIRNIVLCSIRHINSYLFHCHFTSKKALSNIVCRHNLQTSLIYHTDMVFRNIRSSLRDTPHCSTPKYSLCIFPVFKNKHAWYKTSTIVYFFSRIIHSCS